MNDDVKIILFNALKLGREMRKLQKDYFQKRTQTLLTQSKEAEKAFDVALDDAAWAVKYGHPKPKQQTLI